MNFCLGVRISWPSGHYYNDFGSILKMVPDSILTTHCAGVIVKRWNTASLTCSSFCLVQSKHFLCSASDFVLFDDISLLDWLKIVLDPTVDCLTSESLH